MKTKTFICLAVWMIVVSLHSTGFAETIHLRDGKVIKEKIVERGAYYIVTQDEGGTRHKYFDGQVERIEEDDLEDTVDTTDIDVTQFENIGLSVDKAKLILAMIEISKVRESMEQNLQQVLMQVPEEEKERYEELFNVSEIIEQLIPVYDKYYSGQELREIIQFYKSPAGQKVFEVTPKIMKESVAVSLEYFNSKASGLLSPP